MHAVAVDTCCGMNAMCPRDIYTPANAAAPGGAPGLRAAAPPPRPPHAQRNVWSFEFSVENQSSVPIEGCEPLVLMLNIHVDVLVLKCELCFCCYISVSNVKKTKNCELCFIVGGVKLVVVFRMEFLFFQ